MAPKAEFVHYAMAALDCLTGDADAALKNLKVAIDLRPENRYHARNDEDFAVIPILKWCASHAHLVNRTDFQKLQSLDVLGQAP